MTSRLAHGWLPGLVLSAGTALAQSPAPADLWLTNATTYPGPWTSTKPNTNNFADLRAEALAGKLVVTWTPGPDAPTNSITVHASAADLGHWPTRDWRSYPMTRVEKRWQVIVPVEDPDVAIAYFVTATNSQQTNVSAMRGVMPRTAGMDEPTRVFWPFLDGFEQGFESWRITSRGSVPLPRTDPVSRSGYFSLSVSVPEGQRSVTVATTRVRGWQARLEGATGVRVWLRTRSGAGKVRAGLVANAGAASQTLALWPNDVALKDQWQRVDFLFSALPGFLLHPTDQFLLEFIADGPTDFLIDDLQFTGPWKPELE